METVEITINAAWVMALMLAMTRVGAFVLAAPQLANAIPTSAKLAFSVGIGWFLATAIPGSSSGAMEMTVPRIIALTGMNATMGFILGWVLGVLFRMFAMAGAIIDVTAGTSIASVLDPTRGEQGAVFSRLFQISGLALFHALGGLGLLVTSLAWSVRAVPLDGVAAFDPGGLASAAVELVSRLMVASLELALPVFAVLMMAELVLGLAARFAPQANVFLLGLPAKTLLAITTAGMSVALFPEATDGLLDFSRTTAIEILGSVGLS